MARTKATDVNEKDRKNHKRHLATKPASKVDPAISTYKCHQSLLRVKKVHSFRPGTVTLRKIRKHQKSTSDLISKLPSQRPALLTKDSIIRVIENIDSFSEEILQSAAHIISKVTLISNKFVANIENMRKHYLHILALNDQGMKVEENLEFLKRDISYKLYDDEEKLGKMANDFISQVSCTKKIFEQTFSHSKIKFDFSEKLCQSCLESKQRIHFTVIQCKKIDNDCTIDPINCIGCHRNYSDTEKEILGYLKG